MINTDQHTLTARYVKSYWNTNHEINFVTERTHYRMASIEVGYPLEMFRGTKELVHAGKCGFLGTQAYMYNKQRGIVS